jgi:hypothetical protein
VVPPLSVRAAVQEEITGTVERRGRVRLANEQIARMDAELVDLDRVRRIDTLAHGESDLVALIDDDPRAILRGVVLEVVVAHRCAARLGPRRRPRSHGHGEQTEQDEPLRHVPKTISAAISPVASKATIPKVARPTSATARRAVIPAPRDRRRHR